MIEKMNGHYSFTNPATVYDEEALTALELAARTAGKMNECIDSCNESAERITSEFKRQDEYLQHMHDEVFPRIVREEFRKQFEEAFDDAMSEMDEEARGGYLNTRTRTIFPGDVVPAFSGEPSDSYIAVKVPNNTIKVIAANGKLLTLTSDVIVQQLGDAAAVTEDGFIINLPQESVLAFDLEDGRFYIDSGTLNELPHTAHIVLFNYYGNLAGEWYVRSVLKTINSANKGFVYISSDADVNLSPSDSGNGSVDIEIGGNLNICSSGILESFPWEDISSNISEYIQIDGEKAVINLGYRRTLVFNTVDCNLYIRTKPTLVKDSDVILAQCSWGYIAGGWLLTNNLRQSVENSVSVEIADDIMEAAAVVDGTHLETFIYFTDPHLCQTQEWKDRFHRYMKVLEAAADASGADYVVCGGDWLGNDDTQAEAIAKLNYVNGYMRNHFRGYIPVLGNHDTNYQGVLLESEKGTASWTGRLSDQKLGDILFRNEGRKAYYYVDTGHLRFIVLDSQTDGDTTKNTAYYEEQTKWFYQTVLDADKDIVVFIHNTSVSESYMAQEVESVVRAIAQGSDFFAFSAFWEFSKCNYTIKCMIGGHIHIDTAELVNTGGYGGGLETITTTHMQNGATPSFDIVSTYYDESGVFNIKLTRVGAGASRHITIQNNYNNDGEVE